MRGQDSEDICGCESEYVGEDCDSDDTEIPQSAKDSKRKLKTMRQNVLQVLLKSTVMPFRWLKSSYRCFYCYDIFEEVTDLKAHQSVHVDDDVKVKTMNNYWENVVYVDVSNLSCKLCPGRISDLYDLIDHLMAQHGVVYNKDVGICMVAFRLDSMSVCCLVCGAAFLTFGALLFHTNKNHKGTSAILCDVCGRHFKDNILLRLHFKAAHKSPSLLCTECGEKFDSVYKLKTHQKNRHDMVKERKCFVCPMTFTSHYRRKQHMAAEHKNRPLFDCPHCTKSFVFRSMMMTHVRDAHLKIKDHICSVCGWRANNNYKLKEHMYSHSAEKQFKCPECNKAFSTKKIMRGHLRRLHMNTNSTQTSQNNPY